MDLQKWNHWIAGALVAVMWLFPQGVSGQFHPKKCLTEIIGAQKFITFLQPN